MPNRISVIIDATTDKAVASLKSFRTSIADADGATNKMKAGFAGMSDAVRANASALAASAGAALLAFGVKSVQAFNDTALAAGKFSDATGIAVDDASRWMEIGGDVGIGADDIQGAIQRMNKALAEGKPAFTDYGIEVVRTKDGLVDANTTFQNALTTIGAIPDPTKRAQAAQQVFGKSYAEVARLMNMSATDLKAALDGVSDAKVIDREELRKAREFQASMDTLRDKFEDVRLEVGENLVPAISDLADDAVETVDAFNRLDNVFKRFSGRGLLSLIPSSTQLFGGFNQATEEGASNVSRLFGGLRAGFSLFGPVGNYFASKLPESIVMTTDAMGETTTAAEKTGTAFHGMAKDAWDAESALRKSATAAQQTASSTDMARRAADQLDESWSRLKGTIDDDQAWLNLQDQFDSTRQAAIDAFSAASAGATDAEQQQRGYQQSLNATKLAVIDYAAEVLKLPPEQVTKLLVNAQDIDAVEQQLAILTRNRTMNLSIIAKGGAGYGVGARAAGGPVTAGSPYLVGEQGPELVVPSSNGTVIPAGKTAAMLGGGTNTTVNIYTNADPNSTKAALRLWARRNGPGLS